MIMVVNSFPHCLPCTKNGKPMMISFLSIQAECCSAILCSTAKQRKHYKLAIFLHERVNFPWWTLQICFNKFLDKGKNEMAKDKKWMGFEQACLEAQECVVNMIKEIHKHKIIKKQGICSQSDYPWASHTIGDDDGGRAETEVCFQMISKGDATLLGGAWTCLHQVCIRKAAIKMCFDV